eukprot:CAMPEP_0172896094 /NCGR_PEP_ID=MMETSP1075-20121228/154721_1 /TAXON_ID=2916 /ORGANISM="Ceratium fusus, Strain PA161109" /LENGTH=153 /DNA_ID=CAMNT_0013751441 /DNA_START=443 /DNA_END=904 /DNA_ORIENTATION=-
MKNGGPVTKVNELRIVFTAQNVSSQKFNCLHDGRAPVDASTRQPSIVATTCKAKAIIMTDCITNGNLKRRISRASSGGTCSGRPRTLRWRNKSTARSNSLTQGSNTVQNARGLLPPASSGSLIPRRLPVEMAANLATSVSIMLGRSPVGTHQQ